MRFIWKTDVSLTAATGTAFLVGFVPSGNTLAKPFFLGFPGFFAPRHSNIANID